LREALLGERIELVADTPPEDVLGCIATELDPWKLGLIIDAPGERDFVGSVDGSRFRVRKRHRLVSWSRYAPTAVGTVVPHADGSVLRARFRSDPWNRLVFLFLVGAVFALVADTSFSVGEALLIAAIIGVVFFQQEVARRPVRELFRRCTSDDVRPTRG
jgi:hypothetical protein